MFLTVCGTEWPTLCWCAVKKLLTQCERRKGTPRKDQSVSVLLAYAN